MTCKGPFQLKLFYDFSQAAGCILLNSPGYYCPSLSPGNTSGVLMTTPCPFGIIYQLAESVHCLIVQAINSNVKWCWCQYWSLRDAITNWLPAGVRVAGHNPWSPAVQTIFHPPYNLLIQLISHWIDPHKDTLEEHVWCQCWWLSSIWRNKLSESTFVCQ